MARRADHSTLLAPDLRGFGDGDKPYGRFGPYQYAAGIGGFFRLRLELIAAARPAAAKRVGPPDAIKTGGPVSRHCNVGREVRLRGPA
jgi:hypothetical protein